MAAEQERAGVFDAVMALGVIPHVADDTAFVQAMDGFLRPGGRLVFLTNSVLAGLCVPADAGFAGEQLLRPQRDLFPIAWPDGGIEHHPGHGDWIRLLRQAGFVIDALHELYPREGAPTHEYYDIVTAAWAQRWPAEDLWAAHLPG